MDDSADQLEYNVLARPIVACVASAAVLALSGGFSGGFKHIVKQVGAGGASVLVSDYVSNSVFGGTGGMLLSPVVSGGSFMVIQKMLLKSELSYLDAYLTGAAIDVGSQYLLSPIGKALGLV